MAQLLGAVGLHEQKDIVVSVLAELQHCVAAPAYGWLAKQSS